MCQSLEYLLHILASHPCAEEYEAAKLKTLKLILHSRYIYHNQPQQKNLPV